MRHHNLTPLSLALALLVTLTHLTTTTSAACPSTFDFCSGSGFPSNFCCPSGSSCITLASNTTLLCCPAGSDCSAINPILCGTPYQNATLHPESTVKTTDLGGTQLPACGDKCCPFGFTCSGTGKTAICVQNLDQKLLPPSSSPPTSPASSTSPTSTSTLPADSTSAGKTSTTISPLAVTPPSPQTCPRFPTPALLTGLLPGILAGILLSLTTFCLLGARRRRADARAPKISSPTYQGSDFRTDFVRRYQPSSPGTSSGSPATGISRVRSLFRKSSAAGGGGRQTRGLGMGLPSSPSPRRGVPPMPDRDLRAYQQEAPAPAGGQLRREPSSESINIFADPSTARSGGLGVEERRQSAQTTFTDMMERADLRGVGQGEPYVLPVMPAKGEGARLSPARFSPEGGKGSPSPRR
ncbi:hypothetical protein VE00_00727 [Pseudogymnoascus sp. WSF 3629]|nr:hypothetical protein VE00_00727 [Pseudogymnoascus sp. WSF 3629]